MRRRARRKKRDADINNNQVLLLRLPCYMYYFYFSTISTTELLKNQNTKKTQKHKPYNNKIQNENKETNN